MYCIVHFTFIRSGLWDKTPLICVNLETHCGKQRFAKACTCEIWAMDSTAASFNGIFLLRKVAAFSVLWRGYHPNHMIRTAALPCWAIVGWQDIFWWEKEKYVLWSVKPPFSANSLRRILECPYTSWLINGLRQHSISWLWQASSSCFQEEPLWHHNPTLSSDTNAFHASWI